VTDGNARTPSGDGVDDWLDIKPLMVDMIESLKLIAHARQKTILVQLLDLARAEAERS
jgi:hypothetical protein